MRCINISTRIFDGSVSCPGLYDGLYGQNLPYKFKNSYGDLRNRNFEKSHRTTGPRSDLSKISESGQISVIKLSTMLRYSSTVVLKLAEAMHDDDPCANIAY